MIRRLKPAVLLSLLVAVLAGCNRTDVPLDRSATLSDRVFGAEERRAASQLSLGNVQMISASMSPLERALACDVALGRMVAQMRDMGALNPSQIALIERAHGIYRSRVVALSRSEVLSKDVLSSQRTRIQTQLEEGSVSAQVGIGCLRSLA